MGLGSVLQEPRRVVEVTGIAFLECRRTLAGVVALVGDRDAQRDVAAFGLLADPITDLRYGDSRGGPPKGPASRLPCPAKRSFS